MPELDPGIQALRRR